MEKATLNDYEITVKVGFVTRSTELPNSYTLEFEQLARNIAAHNPEIELTEIQAKTCKIYADEEEEIGFGKG